ncbi:LYR family of Fe/S cluster biogenesis protein [Abeliophyllum distichum]|uniref:LYR family of Fe/S cluster biogenesis protein n=1 Tax=Abeliophyllum distichum TaxID=126358 RepID=A0ABD1U1J4_9LAMI
MGSLPGRSKVISLFRSFLKTTRVYMDYNVREYVKRRTIDAFRQNRHLSDPSAVASAFNDGKSQLSVAKRQAVVYYLYTPTVNCESVNVLHLSNNWTIVLD